MPRRARDDEGEAGVEAAPERPAPPLPGLPDPESVLAEGEFTSPKGVRYRVLHTSETDAYDRPAAPPKRTRRGKGRPRTDG